MENNEYSRIGTHYEDGSYHVTLTAADNGVGKPIYVPGNVKKLVVEKDCDTPVALTIMGESMQPCIGMETHTGMSFGRFSLPDGDLESITLVDVNIICLPHSDNPAFAIGSYGHKSVPKIELVGQASLECPEMAGERYMVNNIRKYDGSTKLTGSAYYFVVKPGESINDYMTDRQRELIDEISNITHAYDGQLDATYSEEGLRNLLAVTKLVIVEDPTKWKGDVNSGTYYMTLRTCALLHMPLELAGHNEFMFEVQKIESYICAGFNDPDNRDTINCAIMKMVHLLSRHEASDLQYEMAYEVIPSYMWDYKPKERTHKEEVDLFIAQKAKEEVVNSADFDALTDEDVKQSVVKWIAG